MHCFIETYQSSYFELMLCALLCFWFRGKKILEWFFTRIPEVWQIRKFICTDFLLWTVQFWKNILPCDFVYEKTRKVPVGHNLLIVLDAVLENILLLVCNGISNYHWYQWISIALVEQRQYTIFLSSWMELSKENANTNWIIAVV